MWGTARGDEWPPRDIPGPSTGPDLGAQPFLLTVPIYFFFVGFWGLMNRVPSTRVLEVSLGLQAVLPGTGLRCCGARGVC